MSQYNTYFVLCRVLHWTPHLPDNPEMIPCLRDEIDITLKLVYSIITSYFPLYYLRVNFNPPHPFTANDEIYKQFNCAPCTTLNGEEEKDVNKIEDFLHLFIILCSDFSCILYSSFYQPNPLNRLNRRPQDWLLKRLLVDCMSRIVEILTREGMVHFTLVPKLLPRAAR